MIYQGDCLDILPTLDAESVDSIVTDPPYGISFMGKKWDYDVPSVDVWRECLRVLKPGGHLLSFAGTRTQHRMAVNIEDAGFEIRDMIAWVYGSGFPKSLNVGKAVDKQGGQNLSWFIDYILKVADEKGISRKELTMLFPSKNGNPTGWLWNKQKTQCVTLEQYHKIKDFLNLPFENIEEAEREVVGNKTAGLGSGKTYAFTDKNSEANKEIPITKGNSEWEGYGTALKPALEPITLARKPLSEKSVVENVLKWGTGGINIDGCRVETEEIITNHSRGEESAISKGKYGDSAAQETHQTAGQQKGRFPANIIHDGSEEVLAVFPDTKQTRPHDGDGGKLDTRNQGWGFKRMPCSLSDNGGSAARFFYCAKASKQDRDEGCDELPLSDCGMMEDDNYPIKTGSGNLRETKRRNNHPTVKPTSLMRYLCKLVTPPGGTILDPFMGSGSTGKAAALEGFRFIGIELEKEYTAIAEKRIMSAQPLFAGVNA